MNRNAIPALAAIALVAGCSSESGTEGPSSDVPTIHEVMAEEVDLVADEVWQVGNEAIGANAGLDPALMDDRKWAELEESSTRLAAAARKLGGLDPLVLVKPGVTIADENVEGGTTSAQVQGYIDARPQDFRAMAETLALHMDDLAKAARERDFDRAGPLINQLDGVCESCHLEFWYPTQKDLVEKYMNEGVVEQQD